MVLYHYYDAQIGPFRNLSDLTMEEADEVLAELRQQKPDAFCAKRAPEYMQLRHYYEDILRTEFEKKGGIIKRKAPHYMVVEQCPWLATWFEHSDSVAIDISELDTRSISFTYGDSHPTFSDKVNDGREYRKQLYTYDEILKIIDKYGYPQDWNADGKGGPERYIEAHVWSDEILKKYYRG